MLHPLAKGRTIFNIKDYAARKIAHKQWKQNQIGEAIAARKAAAQAALIEEGSGLEAWQASRKAMYVNLIEEADTTSINKTLDTERRSYLETAIKLEG